MGLVANKHSGKTNRHYHPVAEINVTPMVDVMLVLLIIFMVTSPMLVAGIKVDLPDSTAQQISTQEEPISVTIDSKGNLYLNDTEVPQNELIARLIAVTKENKDARIYVRGDKTISYGRAMEIITSINGSGFTKVALLTEVNNSGHKEGK